MAVQEQTDRNIIGEIYSQVSTRLGDNSSVEVRGIGLKELKAVPNAELIVGLPNCTEPLNIKLVRVPEHIRQEESGLLGFRWKRGILVPDAVVIELDIPSSKTPDFIWAHRFLVDSAAEAGYLYKFSYLRAFMQEDIELLNRNRGIRAGHISHAQLVAYKGVTDLFN